MRAPAGRLVLVTLATLFCVARQARADICVGVDVRFTGHQPTAALVQSMQNEVSSIWQPYGVYLQWRTDSAAAPCATVDASFDVIVERHQSPLAVESAGVVLGSTHLQLTSVDHAPIYINYDATRRTLESLTEPRMVALAGHPGIDSPGMGRALGRVLAHEIGHVLLAAPNHQVNGLMRPSFLPEDLVSLQRWSFTLSTGEVTRLRQREQILGAGDPEGTAECNSCSQQ